MIRSAQAGDVEAVRRLVDDAYRHYVARLGKPPGPMLDDYARRIAERQLWVLEDGGTLAGVLVLENAEDGALLLDNIAVAPAAQGRGYGQALMEFAEAEARRRGTSQLRLYTHVLMTENVALYRRLGFHETGRVTEKGYDRVYMAKQLT
ncbi:MAG: GNAT family N-acetyltransferase [Alphaproteobacteria bacterium]|nr:GNAT family N-acetyltransferase [Alphaproteobacteria bacterium]